MFSFLRSTRRWPRGAASPAQAHRSAKRCGRAPSFVRLAARKKGHPRPTLRLERLEERAVLSGFGFPDFSSAGSLNLVGDAAITADNRLRLTPAVGGMQGAAWYAAEKQFAGTDFSTTFQFQLTENAHPPGGSDGFAFIIQNTNPAFLEGGGGHLGYQALANSLAVEFDTFQNSETGDPSHSHISVHTNGTGPNGWQESLSLGSYDTSPALLDDAAVHDVKIAYAPGALSVFLDDMTTPKLTVAVDLAEVLDLDNGKAWVGFTAATGGGWQNHDILSWTYTVAPDVTTTIVVDDASVIEGDSGAANLVFTVNRAGDASGAATVNWATEDRTALAGSDYSALSGQVAFGPGETQQAISISVNGDTSIEPHETLALRLSDAVGGTIADGVGLGTILTDDVTISIGDATAIEGRRELKVLDRFVAQGSGGLVTSRGSVFGPDGNGDGAQDLYVASGNSEAILRYDGVTGTFLDAFVPFGSGGLDNPFDLAFGPDGNLYVSTGRVGNIFRYDATGAFLDVAVSGLANPLGLTFGSDGALYIADQDANQVLRYNSSGLSVFIAPGSGGLNMPRKAIFGPDGNGDGAEDLYVASMGTNQVLRYNGLTGAFLDTFAVTSLGSGPLWIDFGADGYLYTSARTTTVCCNTSIVRFDGFTGAFVDQLDLGRDGWTFTLGPDNLVYNSSNGAGDFIERLGSSSIAAFTVSLSSPAAAPITVNYSTDGGTAIAGSDYIATSGTLTFAPGETTKAILVRTLDDAVYEGNESFVVNLSNPSGGAILTDSQGVGTIVDNEPPPTKFYVVDDAAANRTFEYSATGGAVENYSLTSGNSAPRGAASNAAGDRVWVADKNRKVFVYDVSGGLLGSWTAGTLASSAGVEGVATNGTDVWIVDGKSDKVYCYDGAAGRLSGSQNAAGSFSLNTGNKNPKGIVTDGTHLWVVDDGASDKVFKYTLNGSLVGSWTIDAANKSPTGLTIDPSGASQSIWIVDSGTDRVYEYANARSKTSGSLSAAVTFALAAGNANPQGIADPPPLAGAQAKPSVAVTGGQAVVVWSGNGAGDDQGVFAQRYDHPPQSFTASFAAPLTANSTTPASSDPQASKATSTPSSKAAAKPALSATPPAPTAPHLSASAIDSYFAQDPEDDRLSLLTYKLAVK